MRWPLALVCSCAAALAVSCSEPAPRDDTQPHYDVPGIALQVPNLPGWEQDGTLAPVDPAGGGTVFRLVRSGAVAGTPRISVIVDPVGGSPATLEEFLTRSLRQMAELEKQGSIHIDFVDQRPARVGPRTAYRVRHEYSVGRGAQQMAITQVATLLVLDGRGVAVIAAGRTELFHPLATSVESLLAGVATSTRAMPTVRPLPGAPVRSQPLFVEPIDLGKVGGRN
ncbi:MAG: hypothetical protein AAB426_00695 [Myxococcota bacterium]